MKGHIFLIDVGDTFDFLLAFFSTPSHFARSTQAYAT